MKRSVLILGGTAEARALAAALAPCNDLRVISSLAGAVANPRLPAGEVRVGGFGGPERLAAWLRSERVDAVVDATHPFAERISASAAAACWAAGVPRLRLERPGWTPRPGDRWEWVDSLEAAARAVPELGRRAFLTTGRQGLAAFADVRGVSFLIRCVDPPAGRLPAEHELLLDRGPYTLAGERGLFERHGLDVLVTKDSGGEHTAAKLDAARELACPVVVVRRPARPRGERVTVVEDAIAWVHAS